MVLHFQDSTTDQSEASKDREWGIGHFLDALVGQRKIVLPITLLHMLPNGAADEPRAVRINPGAKRRVFMRKRRRLHPRVSFPLRLCWRNFWSKKHLRVQYDHSGKQRPTLHWRLCARGLGASNARLRSWASTSCPTQPRPGPRPS